MKKTLEAQRQKIEANKSSIRANKERNRAEFNFYIAMDAKKTEELARKQANDQAQIAIKQSEIAQERQKQLAVANEDLQREQKKLNSA